MPYLFKHFIANYFPTRTQFFCLLSIGMTALAGCASVTNDNTQTIRIQAFDSTGREISGAHCRMENNFGVYRFNVPAPVIVYKSKKNLQLTCDAIGYEPVALEIESASPIHYVGSRALDLAQSFSRASAYFYPYVVTVQFGSTPVKNTKKIVKPDEGSLLGEVKAIGKDLGKDLGFTQEDGVEEAPEHASGPHKEEAASTKSNESESPSLPPSNKDAETQE